MKVKDLQDFLKERDPEATVTISNGRIVVSGYSIEEIAKFEEERKAQQSRPNIGGCTLTEDYLNSNILCSMLNEEDENES